ncbi:MAG: hypothetical protein M1827_002547 [Pycnora praestabilis]|nr:MAG: hypothetical protein M1827_002547 [Pycnora praestabilis]
MTASAEQEDRATELARTALRLVKSGRTEEGARALREAASLAPKNQNVKNCLLKIQEDEEIHSLLKACRGYVQGNEDAGTEALQYLRKQDVRIPDDVGKECFDILLEREEKAPNPTDERLITDLLRLSLGARIYLARRLEKYTTETFKIVYELGDGVVNGLITVVLDAPAWESEKAREQCEKDVLQLLIAKLIELGDEHRIRAMTGIARLFAVDAKKLHELLDADDFEAIVSSLDNRLPLDVRGQATLALAKYMEVSGEKGQMMLADFIATRVALRTNEDYIVAFSVAAAVFPIVPSVAAALFLTQGFVVALAPLVKKSESVKVELSALDMMSAACIDKACREAIGKHCPIWLEGIMKNDKDERAGKAAVILAKVRGAQDGNPFANTTATSKDQEQGVDQLISMFTTMMSKSTDTGRQGSVEGLAYASLQPKVKETLAKDATFLENLINTLANSPAISTIVFGGLTILVNLTRYLPHLSSEQGKISQLKAYANSSQKTAEPSPLDSDTHVTMRCAAVLSVGTIPLFVTRYKTVTSTTLALILNILLSLSHSQKHRGQIAQQGGIRLLLSAHTSLSSSSSLPDIQAQHTAAHALARILISVNPTLVFNSSSALPITSAIRSLLSLLTDDPSNPNTDQRDLLPVFESLLALTNLASTDDTTRSTIMRLAWSRLEDFLLSSNSLIQRATVELICNLMAAPEGVAKFADGSKQAGNRMHILLALADVDDYATRRAAGGALAMLTEWDRAVEAVVGRERGIKILLGLCGEDEDELRQRGVVCVRNVVGAEGDAGRRGREKVKGEGGVEVLKGVLRASRDEAVLEVGVEALKMLVE